MAEAETVTVGMRAETGRPVWTGALALSLGAGNHKEAWQEMQGERGAAGLFTSLAPFLGSCHMVVATPDEFTALVRQPTPHRSEHAPVSALLWGF